MCIYCCVNASIIYGSITSTKHLFQTQNLRTKNFFKTTMCTTVSILSRLSNLSKELSTILPGLHFRDILAGIEVPDVGNPLEYCEKHDLKERINELRHSEIIVADFDLIAPYIHDLTEVKWIQGTWAGVDGLISKIDPNKLNSLPLVTRFSGKKFGQLMSEYVIAQIVNYERDLFLVNKNQETKNWDSHGKICSYRSIEDLTFGIMGLGKIGLNIAQTLNFFGGKVLGYGRKLERDPTEMNFIIEYYSKLHLAKFLRKVDYIVNVLPSTFETKGLLNGSILENCQAKSPVLINIGRGSIISETELVNSLNKKWISAAILDVFIEEPLPKHSVLWSMPQVFITPHVSGVTRERDVVEFFRENYQLYKENKPLRTVVDFKRGY